MAKIIFFSVLFFSLPSFGSVDSIPVGTLISQLVNVSLLTGLIYFSQKKKVIQLFRSRKENFLENAKKSRELKEKALSVLEEITQRFNKMSETFDEKTKEAERNSEISYQNDVNEAKTQALRLHEIVQKNFEFEVKKQIESLKRETFLKSINLAEKEIKKKFSMEKLKAWNSHFISSQRG